MMQKSKITAVYQEIKTLLYSTSPHKLIQMLIRNVRGGSKKLTGKCQFNHGNGLNVEEIYQLERLQIDNADCELPKS